MLSRKKGERGFTIMGLFSVLFAITLLAALVGGIIYAFYNASRVSSLEGDVRRVQTAVNDYAAASSEAELPRWPTKDGNLPSPGGYALINFTASFRDTDGDTKRFSPDFLKSLPRHWSKGVWLIDSEANVSVDMEPEEY